MHAVVMSEDAARERYRTLPEPVRPEDTVETTDTNPPPAQTLSAAVIAALDAALTA